MIPSQFDPQNLIPPDSQSTANVSYRSSSLTSHLISSFKRISHSMRAICSCTIITFRYAVIYWQ